MRRERAQFGTAALVHEGLLADGEVLESDIVMSAVGRMPNSAGFGYPEAGIEMDRAAVRTDEFFRTNIEGVYAIGDLIGGMIVE